MLFNPTKKYNIEEIMQARISCVTNICPLLNPKNFPFLLVKINLTSSMKPSAPKEKSVNNKIPKVIRSADLLKSAKKILNMIKIKISNIPAPDGVLTSSFIS